MSTELLSDGSMWGVAIWGIDFWRYAVLDLDPGLTLQGNPQDTKMDVRNVLFADGSKSEGNEIQSRKLVVAGIVVSESRDEHRATMDAIRYQCSRPALRLRPNGAAYWVYLAGLVSITEDPRTGFDRAVSDVRITFQCDDPFWYSQTLQNFAIDVAGGGTFFVNGLTGGQPCNRGNSPIITITAPPGASVSDFTLTNVSDDSLFFGYTDTALRDGASVAIDCQLGTITRTVGGVVTDATRYFSGEFMRLLTQTNTIRYTGSAANISFTWRPRWI
jgi:hypothetical protein